MDTGDLLLNSELKEAEVANDDGDDDYEDYQVEDQYVDEDEYDAMLEEKLLAEIDILQQAQ